MKRALHAEWTKVRTVPGTIWLLTAAIGLTVALSAASAAAVKCPAVSCNEDTIKLSLTGIALGQALIVAVAVLAIGGEYSTGLIRISFAATPQRESVLAAKAAVVGGLVLAASTIAVFGACWPAGSSCPAMASPRLTGTRSHLWSARRYCAPPSVRSSTSP